MIVKYLDASAWIRRYVAEPGTELVRRLFSGRSALACSTLGLIEVLSTLARKQRAAEITPAQFDRLAEAVEDDFAGFIQIDFTPEVLDVARTLPALYALRGADAVHLASAVHLRAELADDVEQVEVITSDAELLQAARLARFPTLDPGAEAGS